MSNRSLIILIVIALVFGAVYSAAFTVSEKEYAIRFALGKFEKSNFKPGLHWMIPFYNVVNKYDKRLLSYDAPKQRYLTKDKQPLDVDYYVKWRIVDVETYYRKMQGSEYEAKRTFDSIINKGLLDAFGERTMWELISDERADVMSQITKIADGKIREFGIEIVDVRVKRIEMPDNIREQIFTRMITERKKEAAKYRAEGVGAASGSRSDLEELPMV